MPRYREKERPPTPTELRALAFTMSRQIVVHIECCQECNKAVNCHKVVEMNDWLAELIRTKKLPEVA